MNSLEQYISYLLQQPKEEQIEFISDMHFNLYKTDEVTFTRSTSDSEYTIYTKKIKDLDDKEIQLLFGDMIGRCRELEETKRKKLKPMYDKLKREFYKEINKKIKDHDR